MRDLKNRLTPGKNTRNIQRRKGKSFGYQILGFGSSSGLPAGIGLFAGGGTPSHTQNIDKILMTSTGSATDFGDLVSSFNDLKYLPVFSSIGGITIKPITLRSISFTQ